MKKLYTLAAAAVVALSMNAQDVLYFCGEAPFTWSPDAPTEVTKVDGKFTYEADGLSKFKMSTTKDNAAGENWAGFNAGALVPVKTVTTADLGTDIELVAGSGDIIVPTGDYTITVSGDLKTINLKAKGAVVEQPKVAFIRGGMNDWGAPELWKMEATDNETVFWFDAQGETMIAAGVPFKFADESWGTINYTLNGEAVLDLELPCEFGGNENNTTVGEDYTGTIKLTITGDQKANVIFYSEIVPHTSAGIAEIEAADEAAAEYFNLQGVRVANPENGLYIVRKGGKVSKVLVK